jgi:hypothetical protein
LVSGIGFHYQEYIEGLEGEAIKAKRQRGGRFRPPLCITRQLGSKD